MHFKILKYPSLEDISFTVLLSEFLRQNTTNRRLEALFNQSFFLLKTPFRISGAFVGPSAAGLLMDHFSVGWATQVTTKAFPHKYFLLIWTFFFFPHQFVSAICVIHLLLCAVYAFLSSRRRRNALVSNEKKNELEWWKSNIEMNVSKTKRLGH